MKLKIIDSFGKSEQFISEGETLIEAYEDALNQLGYQVLRVVKEYCSQNEGNCETCSLVNYSRDCENNIIQKGG